MRRPFWVTLLLLQGVYVAGMIFAYGVALRFNPQVPGWTPWAIQAVAMIIAILLTGIIMEDLIMNTPNDTEETRKIDPPVVKPWLEEGESLENPHDPITYSERRHVVELGKRLPALRWRSSTTPDHSWQLFLIVGKDSHDYQIIKAPIRSADYAPYFPRGVEDEYIVSVLNAAPRYEALVQVLEQMIAEDTKQANAMIHLLEQQNELLSQSAANTREALIQRDEAVNMAWFYARHEEGCPAPLMSSVVQMEQKCTCMTGMALRAYAGVPKAVPPENSPTEQPEAPPVQTTRIRFLMPGEGDNTPLVKRARARAEEESEETP